MSFNFTKEEYDKKVHSQEDYVKLKKMAEERDGAERQRARQERLTSTAQRQQQRTDYELTMQRLQAEEVKRESERERVENPKSPWADRLAELKDDRSSSHINMTYEQRQSRLKSLTQADKKWQSEEGEKIKVEARKVKMDADPDVIEMRDWFGRFKKGRLEPEEKAVMGQLEAMSDAGVHKDFWQLASQVGEKAFERRSKELAEKQAANQTAKEEIETAKTELKQLNDNRHTAEQHLGEHNE